MNKWFAIALLIPCTALARGVRPTGLRSNATRAHTDSQPLSYPPPENEGLHRQPFRKPGQGVSLGRVLLDLQSGYAGGSHDVWHPGEGRTPEHERLASPVVPEPAGDRPEQAVTERHP